MKKGWLKHAFAVDPPGPAEPTPEQQVPVDWLAKQVTKRHLTTPGLLAIEMCRPMNWLISQGMVFTEPAVWAVAPKKFHEHYKNLASFTEQRGSFEYLCRRIEHFEAEATNAEKQRRRRRSVDGQQQPETQQQKDGDEQDRS